MPRFGLLCDKGHKLLKMGKPELEVIHKDYDKGFMCNLCMGTYHFGAQPLFSHNCPLCCYDLCELCVIRQIRDVPLTIAVPPSCSQGHPLKAMTLQSLTRESGQYQQGFRCLVCNVSKRERPETKVAHCSVCRWDMCDSCILNYYYKTT
ncbi:hypothetical protein Pelo_7949 [Pelomyxa schiedti]|nr:hypothetical protein Pelo_7949 [Pelomyxa schiedti]